MFSTVIKKHSSVVWCVMIAIVGLAALGAHELEKYQDRSEWVTINAPDPPAPLPYPAVTHSSESDGGADAK